MVMLGVLALLGARVAALHNGMEKQVRSAVALLAEASRLKEAVVDYRRSNTAGQDQAGVVSNQQMVIPGSSMSLCGLVVQPDELAYLDTLTIALEGSSEVDLAVRNQATESSPEALIAALVETVELRLEARLAEVCFTGYFGHAWSVPLMVS